MARSAPMVAAGFNPAPRGRDRFSPQAEIGVSRRRGCELGEFTSSSAARSGAPRPHAPHSGSGCCPLLGERPRCHASGALRHQRGRGAGCRRQAAARRNAGNYGNSADAPPRRAPHAAANATLGAGRSCCTARCCARRPPVAPQRTSADAHRPPRSRRRRSRPPRRSRSRSRSRRFPRPTRRRASSGAAPSKRVRSLYVPAPSCSSRPGCGGSLAARLLEH